MSSPWQDFVTGEFATKVVTPILVSLATTLVAGGIKKFREDRERKKNAIVEEVKRIVVLVRELSEKASVEVEVHLLGNPTKGFKDSQRRIGSILKAIAVNMELLKLYLPSETYLGIDIEFRNWTNKLTEEPYPIQRKANAIQGHDPRLRQVATARGEWEKCLSKFVTDCTAGKILLNSD